LVHFLTNLLSVSVTSVHFYGKYVAPLSSCSRLTVGQDVTSLLDFIDHLHLIWAVDDEFSLLAFIDACPVHDFALRSHRRDFI